MTQRGDGEGARAGGVVQAVDRALEALIHLEGGEHGVTEVAEALGVDKSTASRLLGTLLTRGFVSRNPVTNRYRLGPRLAALGQAYLDQLRPSRDLGPVLERLSAATGESVLLTVFDGHHAVYVDKVESRHRLRTHSRIGQRARLHCGAAGKSILASLSREEAERLLGPGPLERFTPRTITDREALYAQLEQIRRQGYATSVEEIDTGVIGIGVPLLSWDGRPLGAISVTAPLARIGESQIADIVTLLRAAAEEQHFSVLQDRAPAGSPSGNGAPHGVLAGAISPRGNV